MYDDPTGAMAHPRRFNRALVEALGLDKSKVRSVDISTSLDGLPVVRVELLVSEINAKGILQLVSYYRLVPDPKLNGEPTAPAIGETVSAEPPPATLTKTATLTAEQKDALENARRECDRWFTLPAPCTTPQYLAARTAYNALLVEYGLGHLADQHTAEPPAEIQK